MEAMEGYHEVHYKQLVNTWNERKVTIEGMTFKINKDIIDQDTSLLTKGQKWKMVTKFLDENRLNIFFKANQSLVRLCYDFDRD